MQTEASRTETIPILRALADPTRLEICRRLALEELCVCHLVADMAMAQPLVSHHLKSLRESGLVESRRHSYWTYYRLRRGALDSLVTEMTRLNRSAPVAPAPRPCC